MKSLLAQCRRWLQWLIAPAPWWVVLMVAALAGALYLLIQKSSWASPAAAAYQLAGALLAVVQYVKLQEELNSGWTTKEIRSWWSARPVRRTHEVKPVNMMSGSSASSSRATGELRAGASHDEQLLVIWTTLKALDAEVVKLGQDTKRQLADLSQRVDQHHKEAQKAAETVRREVGTALTSAPLMAVTGFCLILLGSAMQVWLAFVEVP